MIKLPTIVPKTIKRTPTNPHPTVKARNRTPLSSSLDKNQAKASKCRLFSEIDSAQGDVNYVTLEEQSEANGNTNHVNFAGASG